jgi:outer membrane protein TolC
MACGLAALLLAGCSAAHYRRSADKEVYGIVQQVEGQIFGHTNAFTIDTAYSSRKPAQVPFAELIEDRLQTNQRVLTIEDALDFAVNRSRRYQSAKETLYLTALTLTGNQYKFSPQFFASSVDTVTRTSTGERNVKVVNTVGVTKLLKTGGTLGMSLANDILRYYTGNPRLSVITTLNANLTQPLLRGFGRNNSDVDNLRQAERNVIYAVRNFSFFQDQFTVEIVDDYFDLLAQKQTVRNRYTNYLGRVQSTQRLEARAHDRERLADVDQARQAELTAKDNYINAVATLLNSQDQFKIKLGLPIGEKIRLEDGALGELEKTGLVPAPLSPLAAYRFATEKQLEILNSIDKFEDSQRKVRVAADQLRTDLKLIGKASLDSESPTDYTHFDPNQVSASVGLELNLPIDRLTERNSYRASLVAFESELRAFTLTLDTLKESISKGLRTLEQQRQNYDIQKNALELANRRVASATMLLEAGRAEVRDLVDAQDAQISAQNAVTTALVSYQQSRLQLLLDIGTLDAAQPRFWLQENLTAARAGGMTVQPGLEPGNREVPTPERFFDTQP